MASTKKEIPVKRLHNLYESIGLYDAIYNRPLGYKMGEANVFASILQSEAKRPKNILELFASSGSRHKDFFSLQYNYWGEIEDYKCLDGFAAKGVPNVISADAGFGDFGEKFDAIFAYYYAVSSAVDPNSDKGLVTWDYMEKIFSNVRKHLNPGGIFIIDSAVDGYRLSMESLSERSSNVETVEFDIPLGHSLRAELKAEGVEINDSDDVTLKNKHLSVYNRLTGNCEDHFKNLKVYVNGKARFIYRTKQPFCQRYFSEPEIVRMLQNAGFSSIDFWCGDYRQSTVSRLGVEVVSDDAGEGEEESLMANVFVART